jgi:hypothetical protein
MNLRRICQSAAPVLGVLLVACVGDAPAGSDAGPRSDAPARFCDGQTGAIFCADFDGAPFTEGFTLDCPPSDGSVTQETGEKVSAPAAASLLTKSFTAMGGTIRSCTISATLPTTKRRLVIDLDVHVVDAKASVSGQFLGVVDGARVVGLNAGMNNWVLSAGEPGTAQQKLAMYNAIPVGSWVHLTLEITRDPAAGTAALAVSGNPSASVSGAMTTSAPGGMPTLRLGPRTLGTGMQVDQTRFLYDNVVVRAMD